MGNEKFAIEEVEKLVKHAYNVGFCDGVEGGDNSEFRDYADEDDFWNKNVTEWLSKATNDAL